MSRYVLSRGLFCPVLVFLLGSSLVQAQAPHQAMNSNGTGGGVRFIEAGQPPVVIHATVEAARQARRAGLATTSADLYYHGGTNDAGTIIGVETAPNVYVVFWGSQWNNNDPSGEANILIGTSSQVSCKSSCPQAGFVGGVGGSSWLNSVTQYCQGVASGTYFCSGTGTAGNQVGMVAGYWYDNTSLAPSHPKQSQFASEAVNAARHFGNTSTTSNASVQYVIATATRNNSRGFGTQFCAYHSSTSSSYGDIAYTNLPYITDAGANCGANFNGLGSNAGITIVEGHELAETVTDQFPSSGWLDSGGAENGDKCAWISSGQGAAADVSLATGPYPVQSLWSNAFNSGSGGCVLSYP